MIKKVIICLILITKPLINNADTENEIFTTSNLIKFIEENEIKYPKVTRAIAMHESANFSSKLFRTNNNLFGMIKAEKRPTTALGSKRGYAYYKTWQESVLDYKLFQIHTVKILDSESGFLKWIGKHYTKKDPKYLIKIKYILSKMK